MWRCEAAGQREPFRDLLLSAGSLQAQLERPDVAIASGAPGQDTCVYRVPAGDTACYVKVYRESNPLRSRGRQEWENLHLLHSSGIAVPTLLALGTWRDAHGRCTVLVTAQVDGATDLATLVREHPGRFADPVWFAALCDALALQVRQMHEAGFAHNDLNWRNILVSRDGSCPRTWIFDCPSGRRWVWPFLGFRITKDLTHLDKMGRRYLRATQRMRFFKAYCQCDRLSAADKRLVRKVLGRKVNAKYQPIREH